MSSQQEWLTREFRAREAASNASNTGLSEKSFVPKLTLPRTDEVVNPAFGIDCDLTGTGPAEDLVAAARSGDRAAFAGARRPLLQKRRQFSPPLLCRLSKAHAWSATVVVDELDLATVKLGAASSRRRGSGPFPYVSLLKTYPRASAVGVDEFDSSSLQRPLNCFDGPFL
jgi:hypothetical protein